MKSCLGLIILFSAFVLHAGTGMETKTSTLLLRGRVPASTTISWNKDDKVAPVVKFNDSRFRPKVDIYSQKNHRKITITHP